MDREDDRPDPEELLKAIKREEIALHKGRLKVFLGMAAGVGKTYAMLAEAQQLSKDGVDVVVGIVDTHGRPETAALLRGLTIIPPRRVTYKGREFLELDLDAVLKRHPQVVLVDELAHTNVPGSRHVKRWQDVVEILEKGIDVLTTLNVQHIESLKETVEDIVGVEIREMVPDLIIEDAAYIQIVDITPEALLQRLKEGKVYFGEQSEIAAKHFFQTSQMAALRELAMRYCAQKIDHDLLGMTSTASRARKWRTREKLMVLVTPSPFSQTLIRATRRLAYTFKAGWIALYVDDGKELSDSDKEMLAKNLSLAHELGGEVITIEAINPVDGIQTIVQRHGVTQIVAERPARIYKFGIFPATPFSDLLAQALPNVDIHMVREEKPWEPLSVPSLFRKNLAAFLHSRKIFSYLFAFLFVVLFTGINWLLFPYLQYQVIGIIFLGGILILSLFVKFGAILFASLLTALSWAFFFIPQLTRITQDSIEDISIVLAYFLTAVVTGTLIERSREASDLITKREEFTHTLLDIVSLIATSASLPELLKGFSDRLGTALNGKCDVLLKKMDNGLTFDKPFFLTNQNEEAGALWAFENRKEAGWSTATMPFLRNLYTPLIGEHEVVGVLIYRPSIERTLFPEEKNLLYASAKQLALYLEHRFILERKQFAELQILLQAISQTLNKPLPLVLKSAEEIMAKQHDVNAQTIAQSSEELFRLLSGIASFAKVVGRITTINKRPHNIQDVIYTCENKIKKYLGNRKFDMHIQEDLPLVPMDISIMEKIIFNLLFNAIENSPLESKIELDAHQEKKNLVITVTDEGKRISPGVLESVLTNPAVLSNALPARVDLGLVMAKKFAELHGGTLKAENLPKKGVKFIFTLPL